MAVIEAFEGNVSAKAMEEIVRLVGRLAMSSTNLDEILASGTIEKLIFCLRQPAAPRVEINERVRSVRISADSRTRRHPRRPPRTH